MRKGIRSGIFCFFSSRRRHTRYWRDWSSDVCSSDLDLFRDQMRPAVGDRMARVVPDRVDIVDLEIALEIREHLAVARRGKTVGVRKMQDRQVFNSFAVIVYLKLSGSRLSSRPCAVSACGYMKKVSLPPFELGRAKSFAVLNASQFISHAPKSLGLTACTTGSLKSVGWAFSSSTTFLTSAGSTGTQPNPARLTSARQCCARMMFAVPAPRLR